MDRQELQRREVIASLTTIQQGQRGQNAPIGLFTMGDVLIIIVAGNRLNIDARILIHQTTIVALNKTKGAWLPSEVLFSV